MGKKKSPELPPPPTFQADPNLSKATTGLLDYGNRLTNFDFSGNLSPLQDTINPNPQTTQLALQYAQGSLQPAFNDTLTQIRNEAANAGALESSTFTDAITKAGTNLDSQYQAIVAQAGLADAQQANTNRVGLFGTGLNAISSAGGLAGTSQGQVNQFNLDNYNNQVASALSSQKSSSGGLLGGLLGGGGGILAGLALAPFTGGSSLLLAGLGGLAGGAAGALGPQGTGGQLLQAGAGAYGSLGAGGLLKPLPGSSATNDPF